MCSDPVAQPSQLGLADPSPLPEQVFLHDPQSGQR
jgi:hypothetical protein